MSDPKQRPSKKFKSGPVSCAVWENTIQTDDGPRTIENITFQRSYKDAETGQWKNNRRISMPAGQDVMLEIETRSQGR
jgi:hypothetical protein